MNILQKEVVFVWGIFGVLEVQAGFLIFVGKPQNLEKLEMKVIKEKQSGKLGRIFHV